MREIETNYREKCSSYFRKLGWDGGAYKVIRVPTYHSERFTLYTANEVSVSIQYKFLVPIYVFPEMKLRGFVIPKKEL
jgi:hypothetical protein